MMIRSRIRLVRSITFLTLKRALVSLALLMLTCGVASAAPATPFGQDVNDTIDAWLAYAKTNGGLSAGNNASGLVLLALLEKRVDATFNAVSQGYALSTPTDQCLERNAVSGIIQAFNHVASGSFYAYVDGIDLLALSLYASTGGPNPNSTADDCTIPAPYVPVTPLAVRTAVDTLVDRTVPNQSIGGINNGFWGYTGAGDDSSTTQFVAGGLAAARGFYFNFGDPGTRIPGIDTALITTRAGYAATQQNPGAEGGWGYRPPEGYAISYQQTASGLWASELGGATVDDPTIQLALHWQQNHYNYENILFAYNFWAYSYGYYLFSSCKAYALLESQAPPSAGNIGTNDLGTLPADGIQGRLAQRDPTTDFDARIAFVGPNVSPGEYSAEIKRWYYDYAYTIMTRQNADGSYADPYSYWDFWSNQAYYQLCLERSIGGVCVDNDQDRVCDSQDNCVGVANPATCKGGLNDGGPCDLADPAATCPAGTCSQGDSDVDGIGDACDCGNNVVDLQEQCDGTADAACPGLCIPPGGPGECTCNIFVCGNNVVDPGEQCDGRDRAACPGHCVRPGDPNECTCVAVCGDGVINTDVGEECDDGNTVDGDDCSATCQEEGTDLSIVKTTVGHATYDGYHVRYRLRVTNNGPGAADGVTVSDPLPAGLIRPKASTSKGSCTVVATTITCDLGSLTSGEVETITLIAVTKGVGTIVNTATVSATTPDTDTSNNSSTATKKVFKR